MADTKLGKALIELIESTEAATVSLAKVVTEVMELKGIMEKKPRDDGKANA